MGNHGSLQTFDGDVSMALVLGVSVGAKIAIGDGLLEVVEASPGRMVVNFGEVSHALAAAHPTEIAAGVYAQIALPLSNPRIMLTAPKKVPITRTEH